MLIKSRFIKLKYLSTKSRYFCIQSSSQYYNIHHKQPEKIFHRWEKNRSCRAPRDFEPRLTAGVAAVPLEIRQIEAVISAAREDRAHAREALRRNRREVGNGGASRRVSRRAPPIGCAQLMRPPPPPHSSRPPQPSPRRSRGLKICNGHSNRRIFVCGLSRRVGL